MKNARKWQMITILVVIGGLIAAIIVNMFVTNDFGIISIVDLSLGMVGFMLAWYVYTKERRLEESLTEEKHNKHLEACKDILKNILIFERQLDNIFVSRYNQGNKEMKIGDLTNLYTHHNKLKLVFSSHVDVLEKNMMSRLSQHISMLEKYVKDNHMTVTQHMDNMHDMDDLIGSLEKILKNDPVIRLDNFMKKRRQNKFMLYTLDEIREEIVNKNDPTQYTDLIKNVVLLNYDFEYYLDGSISEVVNERIPRISEIENMLLDDEIKKNGYAKIIEFVGQLSQEILDADSKMANEKRMWANKMRDYFNITNPLISMTRMIENTTDESWNGILKLRGRLILEQIERMNDMTHGHTETLNEILANPGTKKECLGKIKKLKQMYLDDLEKVLVERDD